MPKRKFQEISSSVSLPSAELSTSQLRKQARLLGHLENGQTQLLGALKLARGFERQKLGRRQKDAAKKSEQDRRSKDVERIDAEIKALKALDLTGVAEFYIARTLCRIKTIAASPVVPRELLQKGSAASPYRDPASANVTARLFKSTAVRNAMESIEKEVRHLVGVTKEEPGRLEVQEIRQEGTTSNGHTGSLVGSPEISDEDNEHEDVANFANIGDKETVQTLQRRKPVMSKDDDDVNMDDDIYQDKLASNSETESDSEDEDLIKSDHISASHSQHKRVESTRSVQSASSTTFTTPRQPLSDQTKPIIKPTMKTTFLPTLASGYISGSDSDSIVSDDRQFTDKPKQKNRMGQQARRALAEQLYGAAANHLKSSGSRKSKGRGGRDAGWNTKKGAVSSTTKSRGFGRRDLKAYAESVPNDESQAKKIKPRSKDDTGQLHPSWIAKKKMKEQQNQGTAVFQGKKMVFD